jgi:hypothetical protein
MKTNDLKKGMRIVLRNGWEATIEDNRKGNIRMATVEGHYTETGSIYAHDIAAVLIDNKWVRLEYTEAQMKLRDFVDA